MIGDLIELNLSLKSVLWYLYKKIYKKELYCPAIQFRDDYWACTSFVT